ncbi:MAG TPA: MarR family winged helix-turn-helix transcriptional regulator [Chloroflexia bacterium]|nr:MarR family winged helix-turn-helix transcriptional regulator [Chloroflexia bacterium]
MDPQPPEGDDSPELMLGALLRACYQDLMEGFEAGLAEAGYGDVRLTHTPVLQPLSLRHEGMRASELAALAGLTKPSIGYLIEYLEQGHYVERVPDPSDGRAQLVRLTPRGWEMSRTGRRLVRQAEARWADLIGRQAVEELRQRLQGLVATLGGTRREAGR